MRWPFSVEGGVKKEERKKQIIQLIRAIGINMTKKECGEWIIVKAAYSALKLVNESIFDVHVLKNGTDLHYIQELLGHERSRTTEIYTYVSTLNLPKVTNPATR